MPRHSLLAFLALVVACADAPDTAPAFGTRDSAGVSIVETGTPLWDSVPSWTVDSVPFLSVGHEDGEDPYLLGRPAGALLRDDGSVVVADAINRELRTFDAEGRYLETKGRKGPGPAEFSRLGNIARCGNNEIWIDAGSRISIWSEQLDFLREFKVVNNIMWPLICFEGTGLLVKRDIGSDEEEVLNVLTMSRLHLMVVDSVGGSVQDLMDIPLWERVATKSEQGMLSFPHPFGQSTVLAQSGRELIIGLGKQLELAFHTRSGELRRIVRGPSEDLMLTPAILKQYADADIDRGELVYREALVGGGNPMPEAVPAYMALEVDRDLNIWVQRWHVPGSPDTRWGVFRADGRFLGHLNLPPGIQVHEIGTDYVLGTMMDSLYTQRVQAFRIRK